jgi:hypothetical protein
LFKRIRLDVNNSTNGQQIPWESSSLTSDFYFFGDTAVAATRAPDQVKTAYAASDLPSRAVRQAYDYVLAENSVENYQEFIRYYPNDPLSDRIRALLANLVQAKAWHNAVLTNSPVAYKSFYEKYSNSPYAPGALKLAAQPKMIPLSQPSQIIAPGSIKPGGLGNGGKIVTLQPPGGNGSSGNNASGPGKIVTLPTGGSTKVGVQPTSKLNGEVSRVDGRPAKTLSQVGTNKQFTRTSRYNVGASPKFRQQGMGRGNYHFASSQGRFGGGRFGH